MDKSWRNLKDSAMPNTCILSYSLSVFTIHLICLEVSGKRCNFALILRNIRFKKLNYEKEIYEHICFCRNIYLGVH